MVICLQVLQLIYFYQKQSEQLPNNSNRSIDQTTTAINTITESGNAFDFSALSCFKKPTFCRTVKYFNNSIISLFLKPNMVCSFMDSDSDESIFYWQQYSDRYGVESFYFLLRADDHRTNSGKARCKIGKNGK